MINRSPALLEHMPSNAALADARALAARLRNDYFGRLVVRRFSHLLDQPGSGLARSQLPQFFAALRLILGDEPHAEMQAVCAELADSCRAPDGSVDWVSFHADDRARAVLDAVLVAVARHFHRFKPRKDWFLGMMNPTPSPPFTESHLALLLDALFAAVRPETFHGARRALFVARFGDDPEALFAPVFAALAELASRAPSN